MAITVTPGLLSMEFIPWRHGFALPRTWNVVIHNTDLPYTVWLGIEMRDGRPVIIALTLRDRGGRGLRTTGVRQLQVASYLGMATAAVAVPIDDEHSDIRRSDFRRKGGRPPLSDDFLAKIAGIYVRTSGQPAVFGQAVAREVRPAAPSTLDGWVRTARRRGLL